MLLENTTTFEKRFMQVSWIRRRDWHIMSHGDVTYTSDDRHRWTSHGIDVGGGSNFKKDDNFANFFYSFHNRAIPTSRKYWHSHQWQ
jgi:hypothetical protein